MMKGLFYDPDTQSYLFTDLAICSGCQKIIEKIVYIIGQGQSFKQQHIDLYCSTCYYMPGKVKKYPHKESVKISALVVDKVPRKAQPVLKIFQDVSVVRGRLYDLSIFDSDEILSEKVIDKTYATRDKNFMIQSDAKPADTSLIEADAPDRKLAIADLDAEFRSLMNSTALPSRFDDTQNKLEDKRGDDE